MKQTLLQITQDIASSMDSEEVNSITDSAESMQIATAVKSAFYAIISRMDIPEHYSLFNLTPSGDNTKPTVMHVPNNVTDIRFVKYNANTNGDTTVGMRLVKRLPLEDFLHWMSLIPQDDANVGTFVMDDGTNQFDVYYYNDKAPQYYTSYDDRTLIFDSYDSSVDSTLQNDKSLVWGRRVIEFLMEDTYVPELDESQFPLLFNEAKALAWAELKQAQHPKAEQNSRRGWLRFQTTKSKSGVISDFDKLPDFGRRK